MFKAWVQQAFDSWQARNGGIVRRSIYWVRKYGYDSALRRQVECRNFQLRVEGGQYVIICRSPDDE